jgi:hypothetical protein
MTPGAEEKRGRRRRATGDIEGDERRGSRSAESPISMLPLLFIRDGEGSRIHPRPLLPWEGGGDGGDPYLAGAPLLPYLTAEEPRRAPEREIILVQIRATPLTPCGAIFVDW